MIIKLKDIPLGIHFHPTIKTVSGNRGIMRISDRLMICGPDRLYGFKIFASTYSFEFSPDVWRFTIRERVKTNPELERINFKAYKELYQAIVELYHHVNDSTL